MISKTAILLSFLYGSVALAVPTLHRRTGGGVKMMPGSSASAVNNVAGALYCTH